MTTETQPTAETTTACRSCGSFVAAPGSALCVDCGEANDAGEPVASAYAGQTQAERNRATWAIEGDAREAAATDPESYWR